MTDERNKRESDEIPCVPNTFFVPSGYFMTVVLILSVSLVVATSLLGVHVLLAVSVAFLIGAVAWVFGLIRTAKNPYWWRTPSWMVASPERLAEIHAKESEADGAEAAQKQEPPQDAPRKKAGRARLLIPLILGLVLFLFASLDLPNKISPSRKASSPDLQGAGEVVDQNSTESTGNSTVETAPVADPE